MTHEQALKLTDEQLSEALRTAVVALKDLKKIPEQELDENIKTMMLNMILNLQTGICDLLEHFQLRGLSVPDALNPPKHKNHKD